MCVVVCHVFSKTIHLPFCLSVFLFINISFFHESDMESVRKHLTRGFLCAVLDLSGTLWPLLIPEYSGIKRRGTPFPGLRNPGISHYGDEYPLPFYEPNCKR